MRSSLVKPALSGKRQVSQIPGYHRRLIRASYGKRETIDTCTSMDKVWHVWHAELHVCSDDGEISTGLGGWSLVLAGHQGMGAIDFDFLLGEPLPISIGCPVDG